MNKATRSRVLLSHMAWDVRKINVAIYAWNHYNDTNSRFVLWHSAEKDLICSMYSLRPSFINFCHDDPSDPKHADGGARWLVICKMCQRCKNIQLCTCICWLTYHTTSYLYLRHPVMIKIGWMESCSAIEQETNGKWTSTSSLFLTPPITG